MILPKGSSYLLEVEINTLMLKKLPLFQFVDCCAFAVIYYIQSLLVHIFHIY